MCINLVPTTDWLAGIKLAMMRPFMTFKDFIQRSIMLPANKLCAHKDMQCFKLSKGTLCCFMMLTTHYSMLLACKLTAAPEMEPVLGERSNF